MDRFLHDLRLAARALLRQRSFSFVAVLTLALGVGATTAIFSVVYGILLRPLPYAESEQLVAIGQTRKDARAEPVDGSSSHLNFLDWQRQSQTIRPMALYSGGRAVISMAGEADVVRVGRVTPDFFDVFRAPPLIGRGVTANENLPEGPRALVVSYGFWQERLGGRDDVLSQSVTISGVSWPIVGVAPRGFDFPNGARLWLPVRNDDARCGRDCDYLNGIGRLADGATVEQARDEMTSIAAALERAFPNANTNVTVAVQTLHDRTVGSVRLALVVLFSAVAMVLLIACANVANLLLVRGAARRNELAVRAALGSGRRGLVSYLLTENLLLAAAASAFGVLLAAWGIDLLRALAPANLPRLDDVRFDGPTLLFAVAMIVVTTVLFGLGPAVQIARVPLAQGLGQRGAVGASRPQWHRSALLVVEVGLSVVLLLGAGLLVRSLSALQRTDLGFTADGLTVFLVSLPPARYPADQVTLIHEQLDEALAALPGVHRVARISGLPLGPSENVFTFTRPDLPPPAPGQVPSALYRVVDAEYFDTMKIAVLAGRTFAAGDRAGSTPVAVISRRLADVFWPGEDPVGRPIHVSGQEPGIVVGVVANVRSQALAVEAQPELYLPHAQTGDRTMSYVIDSPRAPGDVLAAARRVVQRLDPQLALIFPASMTSLVDEQLARPRFYLVLLGLFAVLALVLAAVGIYGVVAYVVAARRREIGVRMALGASQRAVVRQLLWQGLRPAIAGVAAGLAVFAAAGRAMAGLLYGVRPHDPLTIVAVSGGLLAVVLVASLIPATRASAVLPGEALRAE